MNDDRETLAEQGRAEILGQIYEVALDPSRYERMLDLWEGQIAPLRQSSEDLDDRFRDSILTEHVARAEKVLAQNSHFDRSILLSRMLQSYLPMVALVVGSDRVIAANAAAQARLGISSGDQLAQIPLQEAHLVELNRAIAASMRASDRTGTFVRCAFEQSGRPIVFRIVPLPQDEFGSGLALATTTEFVWLPGYDVLVRDYFGLSATEAEIVKALISWEQLGEYSDRRGRSVATARTQLRSVFRKVGVNSQAELVRLMLGVVATGGAGQSAEHADTGKETTSTFGRLQKLPYQSLILDDGRRYDYQVIGHPEGQAILFHGSAYGFTRWPARAEWALNQKRLRVIAPVRPGFGNSTDLPPHVDRAGSIADSTVALMDHLGIDRAPMITLSLDAIHAYALSARHPHRLTAIIGCGGGFPIRTRKDYERMGKWFRFIYANARYAPMVLPYFVRTAQMMTRRLGKERFMQMVHGHSAANRAILDDPEVMEAIIVGSETTVSAEFTSHEAVAAESMLHCRDWSDWLLACPVPQIFFIGDDDQAFPPDTMREIAADFPQIQIIRDDSIGELIFFKRWRDVLDTAIAHLP